MLNVHIVTDSCAHFPDSQLLQRLPVTVVPNRIQIGGKSYQEGVDLSAEEALHLMAGQSTPAIVTSPSEADYVRVYNKLVRSHDAILSIHASRELYPSWQNARRAAQQLSGNAEIAVIDSQTLCVGQALLVQTAAEQIALAENFDALVRFVRGAVERVYSVYYVETVNYLIQNKLLPMSHGILSSMFGIKPFLTIENGLLVPIEKVRTRLQAVERIVEFMIEFDGVKDAVILQHKPTQSEQTRMLQDRLAVDFPGREFPFSVYGASLAALIGTDASGLVLIETEIDTDDLNKDDDDDDF